MATLWHDISKRTLATCDFNFQDKSQRTWLHWCNHEDFDHFYDVVESLPQSITKRKLNPNIKDKDGNTILDTLNNVMNIKRFFANNHIFSEPIDILYVFSRLHLYSREKKDVVLEYYDYDYYLFDKINNRIRAPYIDKKPLFDDKAKADVAELLELLH